MTALTHGDFYRGNVLCRGGKVVAVIDWHDVAVRPVAFELAGATVEFCSNEGREIDYDKADDFVAAYRAAGGPVPEEEYSWLLPLMRLWIREDAIASLDDESDLDRDYARKQIRAFRRMANCRWKPT